MNLKERREAAYNEAAALIDKVKAGDESAVAKAEAKMAEVKEIDAKMARQKKGAALIQAIGGLQDHEETPTLSDAHAAKRQVGAHVSFRGLAGKAAGMTDYSRTVGGYGIKGLVPAGETVVDMPLVNSDPIPADASLVRPRRLLDHLTAVPRTSPIYSFLKQAPVADAGGAGVVAPGAEKPVKKLAVSRVDSRLRVVAVLSEPLDRFLLEDASNLQSWVSSQLTDAIEAELENQILTGSGDGEDFVGLVNTSGIQTQSYDTDLLVTSKIAVSKIQVLGLEPAFIALAPSDWLAVQTFRDSTGAFYTGGPIDVSASKLWGVDVISVPGITAGTGYAVAKDCVEVSTDGKLRVDWNTASGFTRNEVQARVEGRFNLDVLRPYGIVKMVTADPAGA